MVIKWKQQNLRNEEDRIALKLEKLFEQGWTQDRNWNGWANFIWIPTYFNRYRTLDNTLLDSISLPTKKIISARNILSYKIILIRQSHCVLAQVFLILCILFYLCRQRHLEYWWCAVPQASYFESYLFNICTLDWVTQVCVCCLSGAIFS